MAKTVSPIFKFQGTIEDLTFVNSRRYKPHVRARKNSKTPFVMTAALAESKVRLQQCNQYAKPVFQALKAEMPDGGLWSRLVSKLFAELKAGRPLGLACLQGLECNLQHKLGEVLPKGYDLSATESQNQLGIYVQLQGHPKADDELPRRGYQVRFVLITPDADNGTFHKTEVLGPLTQYKDELNALDLPIELPGKGAPYILLMGIVPHLQGEGPARIMSDSGMRVVWVGEAASCELRVARESQASSGELRAASGIQEGMERQAASLEPGTAIPTSLSPGWDRATSGIQKGKIGEQVSEESQVPVCVVTGQVEVGQAMNGEAQGMILASMPVGWSEVASGGEVQMVMERQAACGRQDEMVGENSSTGGTLDVPGLGASGGEKIEGERQAKIISSMPPGRDKVARGRHDERKTSGNGTAELKDLMALAVEKVVAGGLTLSSRYGSTCSCYDGENCEKRVASRRQDEMTRE